MIRIKITSLVFLGVPKRSIAGAEEEASRANRVIIFGLWRFWNAWMVVLSREDGHNVLRWCWFQLVLCC
ncbi:hypothetical protein GUJ93_ZPchr0458g22347 [Zizania palustris]|uniref:Uncharacterized protein n=1 Tax=Zizania palustris TaxID=103762 RepID=A0A8J5VE94_ZIZPA|nr:hypothetical protein GUJ93_ZPchr0458g22347 [Zizania palustris]